MTDQPHPNASPPPNSGTALVPDHAVRGRHHSLTEVLRVFGWIGLTSLGQGRVGYFHEELVRKRGWLTDAEFLEGASIGQVLPGPNVTNLSVYFGQRFAGAMGALVATIAILVPGAVMILVLGVLYFQGLPTDITGPVGRGVGAAAVGLVAATTWRSGSGALQSGRAVAVAATTVLLSVVVGLNVFMVLGLVTPASIWLAWPRDGRAR